MSEEKTLITHGHDFAKFLGYEVTISKGEYNKKTKTGATRRVNNGKVLLHVPHDKWVKCLLSYNALKIKYDKQNGNKEVWEPVRRTRLLHLDDLEILNQYNAEIRGLYNYYRLANNVSVPQPRIRPAFSAPSPCLKEPAHFLCFCLMHL